MTPHLWSVDHSYYWAQGNYHTRYEESHTDYPSWAEFHDEVRHWDLYMNLLVRWDWFTASALDDGDEPTGGDVDPGRLDCFWVGQRKATLWSTSCVVHASDEPAVRAWLRPRFDHLVGLWYPLNEPEPGDDATDAGADR